jgi:hypothetical protein
MLTKVGEVIPLYIWDGNNSILFYFHRCFLSSFNSYGQADSEEKIKMLKANGRQMPSDGKSSLCLWQGELKKNYYATFHSNSTFEIYLLLHKISMLFINESKLGRKHPWKVLFKVDTIM